MSLIETGESDEELLSQWMQDAIIEEMDEANEEDGEDTELAYKEVFYELLNKAIIQNRRISFGDLDHISERSCEEESNFDLDSISLKEIDLLYFKNVLIQEWKAKN